MGTFAERPAVTEGSKWTLGDPSTAFGLGLDKSRQTLEPSAQYQADMGSSLPHVYSHTVPVGEPLDSADLSGMGGGVTPLKMREMDASPVPPPKPASHRLT